MHKAHVGSVVYGPLDEVHAEARVVEIPELQQTMLDEEGLRRLFAELPERSLLEATVRATPLARPRRVQQLKRLLTRLVERRVFGAQLRYELHGMVWLDTLVAAPGGMRLVRLEASP
ncbi:MAG TPA: hypothetical protein VLC09_12935 [Polyangiaceae bacterium]|nr:hypothetical protein [Polyangiaceae bacterium]